MGTFSEHGHQTEMLMKLRQEELTLKLARRAALGPGFAAHSAFRPRLGALLGHFKRFSPAGSPVEHPEREVLLQVVAVGGFLEQAIGDTESASIGPMVDRSVFSETLHSAEPSVL
jgi:hypothetical protein